MKSEFGMWKMYKWSPVAYKPCLIHYGRKVKIVPKVSFLGFGIMCTEFLGVMLKILDARNILPVSLNKVFSVILCVNVRSYRRVILSFDFNL